MQHQGDRTNAGLMVPATPQLHSLSIPFPWKLWQLLQEAESNSTTQDVISWLPMGDAFCVKKPKVFAMTIMQRYFSLSNYFSFLYELGRYGFEMRRPQHANAPVEFRHKSFQRNNKARSLGIRRRPKKSQTRLHTAIPPLGRPTTAQHLLVDKALEQYPRSVDNKLLLVLDVLHSSKMDNAEVNPTLTQDHKVQSCVREMRDQKFRALVAETERILNESSRLLRQFQEGNQSDTALHSPSKKIFVSDMASSKVSNTTSCRDHSIPLDGKTNPKEDDQSLLDFSTILCRWDLSPTPVAQL